MSSAAEYTAGKWEYFDNAPYKVGISLKEDERLFLLWENVKRIWKIMKNEKKVRKGRKVLGKLRYSFKWQELSRNFPKNTVDISKTF